MRIEIEAVHHGSVDFRWEPVSGADAYRVYWTDKHTKTAAYRLAGETRQYRFTLNRSPHASYRVYAEALSDGQVIEASPVLDTPIKKA